MPRKKAKTNPEPFNRKTFDPSKFNSVDNKYLESLRNKGWTRRLALSRQKSIAHHPLNVMQLMENASRSLNDVIMYMSRAITPNEGGFRFFRFVDLPVKEKKKFYKQFIESNKGKTFVDLGCGSSPDTLIAKELGFSRVYGIDLFYCNSSMGWGGTITPPKVKTDGIDFYIQDLVEGIKIPHKIDVAICQAVVDLMTPKERIKFYKNVSSKMKKGGLFGVYFVKLKRGHGYSKRDEVSHIMRAGFNLIWNVDNTAVFQKQ